MKGEKPILPLYTKEEFEEDPTRAFARIVPFVIGKNAPTVIVCPGGAYQFISYNNEGAEIARALNKRGYNVFMLVYRVGVAARFPNPMLDLARAVNFVKYNAEAYGIDSERLFIFGASAGGHLAAYFGARYKDFEGEYLGKRFSLRPTGIVLMYPLISLVTDTHEISRATLLGLGSTEEERLDKSVELIADESYPPTFLWHCEADETALISNSIAFDKKLTELGVKHRFLRFPGGGHGYGTGVGTVAEGWINDAVEFMNEIE